MSVPNLAPSLLHSQAPACGAACAFRFPFMLLAVCLSAALAQLLLPSLQLSCRQLSISCAYRGVTWLVLLWK